MGAQPGITKRYKQNIETLQNVIASDNPKVQAAVEISAILGNLSVAKREAYRKKKLTEETMKRIEGGYVPVNAGFIPTALLKSAAFLPFPDKETIPDWTDIFCYSEDVKVSIRGKVMTAKDLEIWAELIRAHYRLGKKLGEWFKVTRYELATLIGQADSKQNLDGILESIDRMHGSQFRIQYAGMIQFFHVIEKALIDTSNGTLEIKLDDDLPQVLAAMSHTHVRTVGKEVGPANEKRLVYFLYAFSDGLRTFDVDRIRMMFGGSGDDSDDAKRQFKSRLMKHLKNLKTKGFIKGFKEFKRRGKNLVDIQSTVRKKMSEVTSEQKKLVPR